MTPGALADVGREVTLQEVERDSAMVAELLDYLRWLAERDARLNLTAGQMWAMFHEGVRVGRLWSEVCADLGLPVRGDWA